LFAEYSISNVPPRVVYRTYHPYTPESSTVNIMPVSSLRAKWVSLMNTPSVGAALNPEA